MTDGAPGNGFPPVLRWFGLTLANPTISHWLGFLLLLVLGGIFGLIYLLVFLGVGVPTLLLTG